MFKTHNKPAVTPSDMQLAVESLEERQMLAPFAFVDAGGTLQIQGDDSSDRVAIVSDGTTITVSGRGLNGSNDQVSFDAASVESLFASLGDGNDRITFESTGSTEAQFEQFQILTGEGNDQVTLIANNKNASGILADLMSIQTGNGNNRVTFESNISGTGLSGGLLDLKIGIGAEAMFINTSEGNDRMTMTASNSNGSFGVLAKEMNMNVADGNDRVLLDAENSQDSFGFFERKKRFRFLRRHNRFCWPSG